MSSSFIYTLLQTNITWSKACHLGEKVNYSTFRQCASVYNTALFANSTLYASKPFSSLSIYVITINTGLLTYFTEQGHHIENLVQVIQITATVHSFFWGNNTQRAAIVCIALIVITKRLGYIPKKLVNLHDRYSYLLYLLNNALLKKNRAIQTFSFASGIIFSELMVYLKNYDPFPETGPTTAIDWRNFHENSTEDQKAAVEAILATLPEYMDLSFLYETCGVKPRKDGTSYDPRHKPMIWMCQNIVFRPSFFDRTEDKNLFFRESGS